LAIAESLKIMTSLNYGSLQDKIDLIWNSVHSSTKHSNQNTIHSEVNQFCIGVCNRLFLASLKLTWNLYSITNTCSLQKSIFPKTQKCVGHLCESNETIFTEKSFTEKSFHPKQIDFSQKMTLR